MSQSEMSPNAQPSPESPIPAAARSALEALGVRVDELQQTSREGRAASLDVWHTATVGLVLALDDNGHRVNRMEREGREWALSNDIPTPEILAAAPDDSWLVTRWVSASERPADIYVSESLTIADRIMSLPIPDWRNQQSNWRTANDKRFTRALRMAVGGVNVRRWLTARQAAEELPKDGMAHGDFYFRNVLDTTSGVQVVDWEFAGPAPHFTDHLRFWSTLKSDEDADLALSLILRNRSSEERNAIGILGRWLAYRLLGENITVRRRFQNPADLTHARAGVGRGERLYAETR